MKNAEKERTVNRDAKKVAYLLYFAACQPKGSEVPKNEVVAGTTCLGLVTMLQKAGGQSFRVGNDLTRVLLEFRLGGLK
jgi:hypothetical protein